MLNNLLNLSKQGQGDLKKAIIACTVSNFASFLPFAVLLQLLQLIIDPISKGHELDIGALWMWGGLGLLVTLLYALVSSVEYDKTYTAAYAEASTMRVEVAEHMRKLPLSFFNRKDLSELSNNIMGDCNTLERVISHTVPQFFATCISTCTVCAMLAIYNWRMSLALFCALPLSLITIALSRKAQVKFGEKHVQAKLNVSDQVQEYLDGIKVIKAFGLAGEKFLSLERSLKKMMKDAIFFEGIIGSFIVLATMFLQVGIAVVIFVGTNLLTSGSLSALSFLFFTVVSTRIYAPLISIMTMLPEMLYMLLSMKRMQALRREKIMTGETDFTPTNFDIEFTNVSFSYGQSDVLKNINLYIPQNRITALVGPSGSGKSTISRLIARFWDVSSGSISIGGKDLRKMDPEHLMTYMSFVFQDVVLFNDTVMNNIRIGCSGASDEDVYRVAKLARCDEFVNKMPDGYNTVLGENGCTISGGERQRLSIARALLKNAPVVLLDEATASLDPENEVLIHGAINELIKGRTVIVIAHRLKTILNADQIVVLSDGEVVEKGKGAELLAANSLFSRLFNIQQESAGWTV